MNALDEGHIAYDKGDFGRARDLFMTAAKQAPTDPIPFSNLSAAEYVMGNYSGSILFSQRALVLLGDQSPHHDLREELLNRLSKSYFFTLDLDSAKRPCPYVLFQNESFLLLEECLQLSPEPRKLREMILKRVPRYRPAPQAEPAYFPVGCDDSRPLVDPSVSSISDDVFACMLCGVGDARHLFTSFLMTNVLERRMYFEKRYHYTLLDIKPAVFARDLVMIQLLFDIASESTNKGKITLSSLAYLFAAQVMPSWIFDRVRKAMSAVLYHLKDDSKDVMDIVYVSKSDRKRISSHLQSWTQKPKEWYNTATLRASAKDYACRRAEFDYMLSAVLKRAGCSTSDTESVTLKALGIMLPDVGMLAEHEPRFLRLYNKYNSGHSKLDFELLEAYIDTHWKPNVSLVDLDYESKKEVPSTPCMDFMPHHTVERLFTKLDSTIIPEDLSGVLNHLVVYFEHVATALSKIRQRIVIEIVIDDMIDACERLQHGLLRSTVGNLGSLDASTFPDNYHRISMSNVPDYVGGPLSTFLHVLPNLHNENACMRSNVLHNAASWASHDGFLAEHLLLDHRELVATNFQANLTPDSSIMERELISSLGEIAIGYILETGLDWQRSRTFPLPSVHHLSRSRLEIWLVAHFLKSCLPFERNDQDAQLIFAPLNMLTFFHLIAHLHKAGYPAHWLSGLLFEMSQGQVTTSARAPSAYITDQAMVKRTSPSRTICLKAFLTEFRTLLALWTPLLRFGVQLTKDVPSIRRIREFKIAFPSPVSYCISRPHFVLVFTRISSTCEFDNLREVLVDDETGDQSAAAKVFRETPNVHVVSIFQWNMKDRIASFWLDERLIEKMMEERDWQAWIWRSDTGVSQLGPVPLHEGRNLMRGDVWC